jgi:hypothetical protein
MSGETDPAGGRGADMPDGGRAAIDTSVAHSARVHDYWLGGKNNYPADRAAGDAVIAAYPGIVMSVRQMAEAARGYNRLARETQRHRSRAEVARFFDGLDLAEPGLVPVQEWRPRSEAEAGARSAMWGGVGRKR